MSIKIKGYCKYSKPRTDDGFCPLFISIRPSYERETLISLGKHIDPSGFSNKLGVYDKLNHPVNKLLRKEIAIIEVIIEKARFNGQQVTAKTIKESYQNNGAANSFIYFADQQLKVIKTLQHEPTYLDYYYGIKRLKEYVQDLSFSEVDLNFLEEYKAYLLNVKKRKPNGIYHDFAAIKKIWKIAQRKGIASHFPFDGFIMPKEKAQISFLNKDQLNRLFDLWTGKTLPKNLQSNTWYFLLACFTGIRLADARIVSDNIFSNPQYLKKILDHNEFSALTSKSRFRKETKLALFEKIKVLLSNPPERPLKKKTARINDDVRTVIKKLEINKHLSFHCGRHTCAVVMLELGVSLKVIQEQLTHSSITTTEVYLHVDDVFRQSEQSKMNNL
ncbi:MAG: site-specific integrase [Reichenbachiella sp.]